MDAVKRFFKYIAVDTKSNEDNPECPSTKGQLELGKMLVQELHELGVADAEQDAHGYVYGTIPANTDKKAPVIGFIAHMDTSPDMTGKDVKPRIVTYDGGTIVLNEAEQIVLSPDTFPELANYVGQELIVTDGTTLLGADDKAGIAAIVSAMEYLLAHPEIAHGKVRVGFTPDEEIGRGADRFDVDRFGCDWAYTIDGGEIGELEYENFNAAQAVITIKGRNVHPGYAQNKMINAALLATELSALLPPEQRPEKTSGYEGFFHLTRLEATVEEATLHYIIRDHDRALFEQKKDLLRTLANGMETRYPGCVTVEVRDQYYNMREIIAPGMEVIEYACEAMRAAGVTPRIRPVRGGTDGARLSFMGLPCPNLFAGGLNFHGRYEYLPVRSLEKSKETIIQLCHIITDQTK